MSEPTPPAEPPMLSEDEARVLTDRIKTGLECEDWFFCTKDISEEDVESAIRYK